MATDPNRFGSKRQSVNLEQADSRVGLAQLTAIGIIAIFILAAVLYGLTGEHLAGGTIHNANSQGGAQQTTQPAASNPANPSQGAPQPGLAQQATPSQNAAAPGGISNPPTTSGQGH
jgi:uncharacterized iron-regulated membrane protein